MVFASLQRSGDATAHISRVVFVGVRVTRWVWSRMCSVTRCGRVTFRFEESAFALALPSLNHGGHGRLAQFYRSTSREAMTAGHASPPGACA